MFREALFHRARLPGADHGAVGRRQVQQPAAGHAGAGRRTGHGRPQARRQFARLARAQAQSLSPRPELRDLSLARRPASISDYRALAKARLPHFLFEYVDGGSYAEVTLRRNVADLEAVTLKQRVLRDVSNLDLTTELFGQRWSLPVALGPVGMAGMYAR